MYISHTMEMPNGATATIHRVAAIEVLLDESTIVRLNSYVDLEETLILWQGEHTVPELILSSGSYPDNVYDWLVGPTGPLNGGTVLSDTAATLVEAQAAKWALIKAKRDAEEYGGVDSSLGLVDSDLESQQRIVNTKVGSDLVGTGFGVAWTMADNTVVWHDKDAFDDLSLMVFQHVNNCHSRSQSLRETLYNYTDIADVEAFDIDYEWDLLALLDETGEVLVTQSGIDLVA